jgi:hypothetical protein
MGVEKGDTVSTPYGVGKVIDINPFYGFKVEIGGSAQWFSNWEVYPHLKDSETQTPARLAV